MSLAALRVDVRASLVVGLECSWEDGGERCWKVTGVCCKAAAAAAAAIVDGFGRLVVGVRFEVVWNVETGFWMGINVYD